MGHIIRLLTLCCVLGLLGCYGMTPSNGGGKTAIPAGRTPEAGDVILPEGYRIEVVARGLTYPTGVAFDGNGRIYVVEAGYSYGEDFATARLLRIEPDGSTHTIATGSNGPWTGVAYHDRAFYVAEGGTLGGGRISRIDETGAVTALVENLPSVGDHHTNGPAIGQDGQIYFAVGTATNSGVVGPDNAQFGWLKRHPEFHDIPGEDIKLAGVNYPSKQPLTDEKDDTALTGAFLPFGTPSQAGQVIKGQVPCSGAVMRIPLAGGKPELVAWGFRNPYGLAFAPDGTLFVTENSFDVRGSRPIWGTGDLLWRIDPSVKWYGWPDYFSGEPLDHGSRFKPPGRNRPRRVLAQSPNQPPAAAAKFGVHSSSNGLDFSRSEGFGFAGEAFVAQFGDMATGVGKVTAPTGFKVVRVDPATGVIHDFAANRAGPGPASKLKRNGLERPVSVRFSPQGDALYVVDFGVLVMDQTKPRPAKETGVLWKITREAR